MSTQSLPKEMIERPEVWQLNMRVAPGALDLLLFSPLENNSLIYRHIDLDPQAASPLKAVEEAIYDNPLLLCDFMRVRVVVQTSRFMAIPPEVEDADDRAALFHAAFDGDNGRVYDNRLGAVNASMTFSVEPDLAGFLERTFYNVELYSHLTPLCNYFVASGKRANVRRMYANLRPESIDLIAVDHAEVLMINTMKYREPLDAIYYIMASYKSLGLDPMTTELLIAGSPTVRDEIVPTLRSYISSVMPVIFPSTMFKAGRDVIKAPFDLIVLPLCE